MATRAVSGDTAEATFLAFVANDDGVFDACCTLGGDMGLFWDLIQQSQLEEQKTRAGSLEARVAAMEAELTQTRQILSEALRRLESKFGEDWDRDGRIG